MVKEIYYTVIEIDLPEWETGNVLDLETYDNLPGAISEYERLTSADNYKWYEIKVILVYGD